MMSKLDLTPSFEKIARAEAKFARIDGLMDEWGASGIKCSMRQEQSGEQIYVIGRVEELPSIEIGWELVEAVGHLRSALGKMIVALADMNGSGLSGLDFPFAGRNPDGTSVPFSAPKIEKQPTSDQWKLVLDQKPWAGGNELLCSINELANQDKHRKDLVKVQVDLSPLGMVISNGISIGGNSATWFADDDPGHSLLDPQRDTLLYTYGFGPGSVAPNIETQSFALGLVFGKLPPVTGWPVYGTLRDQIALVRSIVKDFGQRFG